MESGYAVVAQLVERHLAKVEVASPSLVYRSIFICGCNSMVEFQPSKLATWVRFPSPALFYAIGASMAFFVFGHADDFRDAKRLLPMVCFREEAQG